MDRRSLITRIGAVFLSAFTLNRSQALSPSGDVFLAPSFGLVVETFIPSNKNLSDYAREMDLWLDRPTFSSFVEGELNAGRLLSFKKGCYPEQNKVVYECRFKSALARDEFQVKLGSVCKLSVEKRKALGYRVSTFFS